MSSREIEPLLKLLGYSDSEVHFLTPKDESLMRFSIQVRVQMVSMLGGYTQHGLPLSDAALALWVQCVTDSDLRVRMAFATRVDALLNCKTDTLSSQEHISRLLVDRLVELKPAIGASQLDTFLATLVTVSQGSLPKSATNQLYDCLLSLYFSASTNVTTYARALEPLKLALLSDKSRVMGWCAKAMCRQGDEPRQAVHWLKLLCPKEVSIVNWKDLFKVKCPRLARTSLWWRTCIDSFQRSPSTVPWHPPLHLLPTP